MNIRNAALDMISNARAEVAKAQRHYDAYKSELRHLATQLKEHKESENPEPLMVRAYKNTLKSRNKGCANAKYHLKLAQMSCSILEKQFRTVLEEEKRRKLYSHKIEIIYGDV